MNTDDGVAPVENAELDGVADTPFQTLVDVFLPRCILIIRLGLGEEEWPDTAVEVRILGGLC